MFSGSVTGVFTSGGDGVSVGEGIICVGVGLGVPEFAEALFSGLVGGWTLMVVVLEKSMLPPTIRSTITKITEDLRMSSLYIRA